MNRVLIDTNVVIDYLLEEEPNFIYAQTIIDEIGMGKIRGYITASMATDVFYLLQREKGKTFALNSLADILVILDVLPVYRNDVYSALHSGWNDFEDALQAQVAIRSGMDAIITRNIRDYQNARNIDIFLPQDFIQNLLNNS